MMLTRKLGFYEKYIKRILDIICALTAMVAFCWLYAIIAVAVRVKLGAPIIFKQPRPGLVDPKTGKERVFILYKFRTMSDKRDQNGNLLPDKERLGKFGEMLRATSLDELPEAINILKGDMSVIGPRPQLVRDMVFMSEEQRMRHTARPGLSGLAQVKGRNAITWDEKIKWDLKYLEQVGFWTDIKLVWLTFKKVFIQEKNTDNAMETDLNLDYGDALLRDKRIEKTEYDALQAYARDIIIEFESRRVR